MSSLPPTSDSPDSNSESEEFSIDENDGRDVQFAEESLAEEPNDDDELDELDEFEDDSDLDDERPKRQRRKIYCFHCNRPEFHNHSLGKKWYYSYLLGFSFGIAAFWGPFRCVCCGHRRLTRLQNTHPRMIARSLMGKQTASGGTGPDRKSSKR